MSVIPESKLNWIKGLQKHARAAQAVWKGMRAEVCLAQAALETAWGLRPIDRYNLWGIKSLAWIPGSVEVVTHEWCKETKSRIELKQRFAAFKDIEEAFNAYGRLLSNSPTYEEAREANTLEEYVNKLAKRWATDPEYAKKIMWIIKEAELGP